MRKKVKRMITEWDEEFPGRSSSIFNALKNINPSHLLDANLFDFNHLEQKEI